LTVLFSYLPKLLVWAEGQGANTPGPSATRALRTENSFAAINLQHQVFDNR